MTVSLMVRMFWWHEEAPPTASAGFGLRGVGLVVRLSPTGSFGGDFGDGGSGAGFVDDRLVGGVGGDQGLDGEVVHRSG